MATGTLLTRLRDFALDFVFPPRCAACGRGGTFLHDACAAAMAPAVPPRCAWCWDVSGTERCPECARRPPAFDGLRSLYVMAGAAREAVHALKYRGHAATGGPMGKLMAAHARALGLEADLVAAVPLVGRRRRLRGYNQSEVLARVVASALGLPFDASALRRVRSSPPQARAATSEERRRNVDGAFVAVASRVARRRVLLIDDVATTGATLDACACALKQAGAREVWCLTWARGG
jgi:ComF family protein